MHGPVEAARIFLFGSSFSFLEILFEGVVTALLVVTMAAAVLLALAPYSIGRIFLIWKLFPF